MVSYSALEVLLLLQIIQPIVLPQQTPPIQSCNDPLILDHTPSYSHSYCFHTCGFLQAVVNTSTTPIGQIALLLNNGQPFGDSADAYCHPGGHCVCQPACPLSSPRLQATPDTELCPLDNSVSTPELLATCQATCQTQCGLSVSNDARVCREVELLGDKNDIDTNICTCSCAENLLSCFNFGELLNRLGNFLMGVKYFKVKFILVKLWKKLVKICLFLLKVKLVKYYLLKLFGVVLTWAGLVELVYEGVFRSLEEDGVEGWGKEGVVGYY